MSNNKGKQQDAAPNERLIVYNIPYDTTEKELGEYFSSFGKVVEVDILRYRNGNSRGYGFVAFETVEAATEANKEEHQHEIDGRSIRTNFAKQRKDNRSKVQPGKKLYISNLPWKLNEDELKEYFEQFGEVEDAFLSTVKYAPEIDGYPQHKGFGFVTYVEEENANTVALKKDHMLKDRRLSVRKAKPQKGSNPNKSHRKRNNQPRDEKKKIIVKRKPQKKREQNNGKQSDEVATGNDDKRANQKSNNESAKKDNNSAGNNNNGNAPNKDKNKDAPQKKKKAGPRIVSSTVNPWKKVDNQNSGSDEVGKEFPSLNKKKKKDVKGKGELN